MKKTFGLGILAGALCLCASLGAANLPQLKPENKETLAKLIGPNFLKKAAKVPRVLVFYRCEGFCHGDAIVTANEAYRLASERTGAFTVTFSEDYEDLKPENLAKYDVLVMNNTTNLKVKEHPFLREALVAFTASGKGYVALHAGVDNFADCLVLADMTSGLFAGHPWGAGGTWAFKVDDKKNPVNAAFAAEPNFKTSDEIYQSRAPAFNLAKIHPLVSLDFSDPVTAGRDGKNRPDSTVYPVSWLKPYGKGRVFYTSFGHDARAWVDAKRLRHMFDGYLYCAGQLACDDTPLGMDVAELKKCKTFGDAEMFVRDLLAHGSPALEADTLKKCQAVLKDPTASADVKEGVTKALRGFGAPNATLAYAGTAGATPAMQKVAQALEALAKSPKAFADLYKAADETVKLALVKNADAVDVSALTAVYAEASDAVKAALLTRLAAKNSKVCAALAGKALASENEDLAVAAATALCKVGTAAEIPALVEALKRGGRIRYDAEYAIQAVKEPAATVALFKLAETDDEAFKMLARRADSKQLKLWEKFVKNAKEDVRKSAWRALARQVTEKDLVPVLAWLATDLQKGEVTAAATAFKAAAKNAEQADLDSALPKAWTTASAPARRVIAPIAGAHPSPALGKMLLAGLADAEKDVRTAAAEALGGFAETTVLDKLVAAYAAESDAGVKQTLLAAAFKVAAVASPDLRKTGLALFKKASPADRTEVAKFILRSVGIVGFDDLQSLFGDAQCGACAKKAYLAMYDEIASGAAGDMGKPISNENWKAKASLNGGNAKNAIDNNAGSRWDTGRSAKDGDWFVLELAGSTFVSELTLDTKGSRNDTLPAGEVYVSNDGANWGAAVVKFGEEASKDGVTKLAVNAAGKYVKIVAKGGRNGLYWSIHEISVKSGISKDVLKKLSAVADGLKK